MWSWLRRKKVDTEGINPLGMVRTLTATSLVQEETYKTFKRQMQKEQDNEFRVKIGIALVLFAMFWFVRALLYSSSRLNSRIERCRLERWSSTLRSNGRTLNRCTFASCTSFRVVLSSLSDPFSISASSRVCTPTFIPRFLTDLVLAIGYGDFSPKSS